jgi:hypothetical protein
MTSKTLNELIRQTEVLTLEELLQLIRYLIARLPSRILRPRRRWREICGAAAYPLLGEDAQAWVSRTRREDDEYREQRECKP